MAEYIERDSFGMWLRKQKRLSKPLVIMALEETPPADVAPVVRCKDCTKISPSVTAIKDAVWCREFRAYMPCNGFCSYGERREGE